jgi:PIN like domain
LPHTLRQSRALVASVLEIQRMRDEFPGYYRPSEDQFKQLWDSALIVPDTNVLLTLYRLSEPTQKRLQDILEALKDRLFLSHQVGFEFQENRLEVIDDQKKAYKDLLARIEKFPDAVASDLREHPRLSVEDIEDRLRSALLPVRECVEEVQSEHPDPITDGDAIGADSVRDLLDNMFKGRIGPPRDMKDLTPEAKRRYEDKVPPGFEDERKDEPRRFGDLAIWLDTIDAAKEQAKDVIFVTADRKGDWWWLWKGRRIGPRPELIAEMREKASQEVYLYDIERFMEEASKALGLDEISKEERDDVARAQKSLFLTAAHSTPVPRDW